jgi:hypothetical protein
MAIIQGVNGIHMNINSSATAGSRILSYGKAIPGTSTWTTLIKFTLISGAASNFGISFRHYAGADRQSGTLAENFWFSQFALYTSNGTTWTETYNASPWVGPEGNAIVSYRMNNSGTSISIESLQSDTGAYVSGYCEVQCGKWDQLTISY